MILSPPSVLWHLLAAAIISCQAKPSERFTPHSSNKPSSFCKVSVTHFPFENFPVSFLFLPAGSPLKIDCLGNVMRVSLDKALEMGNELEVEATSKFRWYSHWGRPPPHPPHPKEKREDSRFSFNVFSPFSPLDGTHYHLLSPRLAAQCGYSMESDPWGNTRIYTSLLACYVDSKVLQSRAALPVPQICNLDTCLNSGWWKLKIWISYVWNEGGSNHSLMMVDLLP